MIPSLCSLWVRMGAAMCFVGVAGLRYTYKLQDQISGHSLIATIVEAQCPPPLSKHSQDGHGRCISFLLVSQRTSLCRR